VAEDKQDLYRQVIEVSRFIDSTMRTVSQFAPPPGTPWGSLPQVSAQLSDLTRLTEEGTHQVMGLTEEIQDGRGAIDKALGAVGARLAETKADAALMEQIAAIKRLLAADDKRLMDIMTALSFQDLVGQRVKKILVILEDVQRRLLEMIVMFGQGPAGEKREDARSGQMLKELEASRCTALKQDLVDDILGEYGFN